MRWNALHKQWVCMDCKRTVNLKAGTVMENSNLPVYDWFVAMFLLTSMKMQISALEIKRQLGMKRYEPVWLMVQKLRSIMGQRDSSYKLAGDLEIDEGFFTTERPHDEQGQPLRAGRGSQRKAPVLVMAESTSVAAEDPTPKRSIHKRVGHLKMKVLNNLQAKTEEVSISAGVQSTSHALTDGSTSYATLVAHKVVSKHHAEVMNSKEKVGKVLPWVHVAISNAKSSILSTYKKVSRDYLQGYLDEFCYKFNRRYFGFHLFDRLQLIAIQYRSSFKRNPPKRFYNQID
jgi:hypothetical protein